MSFEYLIKESRLNRLQGTDKRKLRSRDILNALSEARDDHLSHSSTGSVQPATLNVTQTDTTIATNDPWSIGPNSSGDGHITNLSAINDFQEDGGRDGRVFSLELDDLDEEDDNEVKTGCLRCCSKRGTKHKHSRVRVTSSSLTPEEESAFLLHCDHLSRT